jgi:hypothetical protein
MMFIESVVVSYENQKNALLLTVNPGGACSYHWALKAYMCHTLSQLKGQCSK